MIQFLEDLTGSGKKPLNSQEREELEILRKEHDRLKKKIKKQKKSKDSGSSSDSDSKPSP